MAAGRIAYNKTTNRYGLLVNDEWVIDGFHCGDALEIQLDKNDWMLTRVEMDIDRQWYLVNTPFRGCDLEYITARIPA